jgi:hypothetical protein
LIGAQKGCFLLARGHRSLQVFVKVEDDLQLAIAVDMNK